MYCGMCGDSGVQNGVKCPQPGCRKANRLAPFDKPGTPTTYSPSDLLELKAHYQSLNFTERRMVKVELYGVHALMKAVEEFHNRSIEEQTQLHDSLCHFLMWQQP